MTNSSEPEKAKKKDGETHLRELRQSLERGNISSAYLFCGDEDFLIGEAEGLVVSHSIDEASKSFNFNIFYGGDAEAKDIISIASSFPMMSQRRVVVVRNLEKLSKDDKENLLPFLDRLPDSTVMVFTSERPDFRVKFFKTIQSHCEVREFNRLYPNKVPQWIESKIRERGKKISPDAVQLFHSYVGTSLREIDNEIDKLFVYAGDKPLIDAGTVGAVVGMSKESNVFELQNAIGKKDIGTALHVMNQMVNAGQSPVYIVVMLTQYFQKLWALQEALEQHMPQSRLAAYADVNNYYLQDYVRAARNYPPAEIEESFKSLVETDEKLKFENPDHKLILTLLLFRLIKGTAVPA